MKKLMIISNHPGSGQTTIAVNLASGLTRQGYKVLIAVMNHQEKLYHWLGIKPAEDNEANSPKNTTIPLRASAMEIDLLEIKAEKDRSIGKEGFEELDYDYVLLLPANEAEGHLFKELSDHVIACTDLSHPNETADLISLEERLYGSPGHTNHLSLLVLNKINTKEWEHNSQHFLALADYFGYEKIADPIPHCERIHDLPLDRRTIWELSQQNLKEAFNRLGETVKSL